MLNEHLQILTNTLLIYCFYIGLPISCIIVNNIVKLSKTGCKFRYKAKWLRKVRRVAMRVYNCSWILLSIYQIKTHCMYTMFFILNQLYLLFVVLRVHVIVLYFYLGLPVFLVELIVYLRWNVLGGYLEKTYLSMRYSLRPNIDSNLNLIGSA